MREKKNLKLKTDWIKMVSSFDSCRWLRFCFRFLNFIIGIFYPLRLLTEQRKAESGAFSFYIYSNCSMFLCIPTLLCCCQVSTSYFVMDFVWFYKRDKCTVFTSENLTFSAVRFALKAEKSNLPENSEE